MPAVAGNGPHGGDEGLGSSDEVKVFKDEGEDEQEQNASESLQAELLEEKSSLITESEQLLNGKHCDLRRPEAGHPLAVHGFPNPFQMGYLVNPYAAYANGAAQLGRGSSPLSPFLSDPLGSPPPAHMAGLARGGSLPYPPYPYSSLGMEQLAAWHQASSMYAAQQQQSRAAAAAAAGYPGLGHLTGSSGGPPGSPMSRWSPHLHPSGHHPGLPPPWGIPGHHLPHIKSEYDRPPGLIHHDDKDHHSSPKKKEPHIKKPLNAFMLYMKEMRPVVQAECTLKESAAINQILGRRWHGLTREEQAKYYEKARQERQRHMQMYPHWNARDNYRYGQKKKKRKRDKSDDPAANMKKCRARYGLDQQNLWCKPCRRKKKCIRVQMYLAGRTEAEIEATTFDEEGEAITPTGLSAASHGSSVVTNSCSSNGSDGEGGSPASQGGSVESDGASLTSPATPGGGPLSVPSLGSPAGSIASPSTPGTTEDWFRGYHRPASSRPPVGTDPRDSKNPLSISSMTGSCHTSGRAVVGPDPHHPHHHRQNGSDNIVQLGVT